jgi:conjugal transfer pilus assembly protein TraD
VAESLPPVFVRHLEYSQATDTKTDNLFDFGFKITESMKETEVDLVPPQMFTCLPNLEYFARVSGGRVIKGRIPILKG